MVKVFFDGAYEQSTGTIGLGCIVERDGKEEYTHHSRIRCNEKVLIGEQVIQLTKETVSNNVSEYLSVLRAIEWLIDNKLEKTKGIIVYGDSKLVIEQMSGNWGIKEGAYKPYAKYLKQLLWKFSGIMFIWIPRNENSRCDALSRKTL